MKKLSKINFQKSVKFIKENADEINLAWYAYNFENLSTNEFLEVLSKYQYTNGGFGGLVYEYEYNGPTLHDTEHAFRYIFYLKEKPPANHPVIHKMMKYLLSKYRSEIGGWGEELEPEVNDYAHVWWWTYGSRKHPVIININERVEKYNPNGNAAHAGFVALYKELVPEDVYKDIIYYPTEFILRYYDDKSPNFKMPTNKQFADNPLNSPYNLKCLQMFCNSLKDEQLSEKLKSILSKYPTFCMELDSKNWWKAGDYNHPPSDIVETPESFLYEDVKVIVNKSLDCLITKQGKDGAWRIPYTFVNNGVGDNEILSKLQYQFETHLTCLYLAELNRFGRIDK